ncbi:hypothetical protein VTK73DRAFT_8077 [Phialemonium thermophilum]|uniref:Alcohol dehydrogenase iron-type/glycerol dehydrogenase GldA domain-containing protein n=1 Tax=Phialemonium thermophilum TaxID=223376 RepID=A0ABR3WAW9_9PEZI
MAASGESLFLAHPPAQKPLISTGLSFRDACIHHIENHFHASRIYIVVSASLSKLDTYRSFESEIVKSIARVRRGIRPYTPWSDVLEVADDLCDTQPDLIIAVGGGSVTDGAKVASLAYANDAHTVEDLERLWAKSERASRIGFEAATRIASCRIPIIDVPTSLSGAEYTPTATAVDTRTNHNVTFRHLSMTSDLVVLDPELSILTPERVWFSSGIQTMDQLIEGICSDAPQESEETRKLLEHHLRLLLPNLLTTQKDNASLDARLHSLLAAPACFQALELGLGASHGIRHHLGPLGVGHGETSCVVLPAVLRFNYTYGSHELKSRLNRVRDAFWSEPLVAEALKAQGLTHEESDAADVVYAYIKLFGMPRSLAAVGVRREVFDFLPPNAHRDFWTQNNPVPLSTKDILMILEMVADDSSWPSFPSAKKARIVE